MEIHKVSLLRLLLPSSPYCLDHPALTTGALVFFFLVFDITMAQFGRGESVAGGRCKLASSRRVSFFSAAVGRPEFSWAFVHSASRVRTLCVPFFFRFSSRLHLEMFDVGVTAILDPCSDRRSKRTKATRLTTSDKRRTSRGVRSAVEEEKRE